MWKLNDDIKLDPITRKREKFMKMCFELQMWQTNWWMLLKGQKAENHHYFMKVWGIYLPGLVSLGLSLDECFQPQEWRRGRQRTWGSTRIFSLRHMIALKIHTAQPDIITSQKPLLLVLVLYVLWALIDPTRGLHKAFKYFTLKHKSQQSRKKMINKF